jgi:orotidine-5'-phosphate decarboxylase
VKSRIILALDGMTIPDATILANELREYVVGGKANDLLDEGGAAVLNPLNFVLRMADPKLHDIPATVGNRMAKYADNAHFVTVHASNSPAALRKAAQVANKYGLQAIAVTVTTDISGRQCRHIYGDGTKVKVLQFVRKAMAAGVHGIVCSPKEVKWVRQVWATGIIIVPGIRSQGEAHNDQVRVGTPYQAIIDGANYLVVGREITGKPDRDSKIAAAVRINREVDRALVARATQDKIAA